MSTRITSQSARRFSAAGSSRGAVDDLQREAGELREVLELLDGAHAVGVEGEQPDAPRPKAPGSTASFADRGGLPRPGGPDERQTTSGRASGARRRSGSGAGSRRRRKRVQLAARARRRPPPATPRPRGGRGCFEDHGVLAERRRRAAPETLCRSRPRKVSSCIGSAPRWRRCSGSICGGSSASETTGSCGQHRLDEAAHAHPQRGRGDERDRAALAGVRGGVARSARAAGSASESGFSIPAPRLAGARAEEPHERRLQPRPHGDARAPRPCRPCRGARSRWRGRGARAR